MIKSKLNMIYVLTAGILILGMQAATARTGDESISLAGTWRFEIAGADAKAFARELTGKIKLPGTMDDAGLGPRNTKPGTLTGSLKDLNFADDAPGWLYRDAMLKNASVLEGPYRLYDYAGPAWYQRTIDIPEAWQGKRVTLFLERCRWVTTVWVDDKRIGSQDSLISPHVYDLGIGLKPGIHRLTICVDNTDKINLGKFVSALRGGTWGNMNGIVGRIELAVTPPVWIDDVQVYPNASNKTALVKVRIGNVTGKNGQGKCQVSGASCKEGGFEAQAAWNSSGGEVSIDVALNKDTPCWDEFSPSLTELTVKLGEDVRTVRFGLRDFAAKGTQFILNGRPVFLRGTLECSIWPLTGYPPTEVKSWQRIYRIMKSYGLNHIRFHSWCPPEAAFAAADVEGIIVQAEAPRANVEVGEDAVRDAFTEAELKRIIDAYGNHPSFCLMTLGNEYGGTDETLSRWVDMLIKRDPRHLYSSASSAQTTANRQWTEHGEGRGIKSQGTMRDLRDVVAKDSRPSIGHEVGQWMYWPDSREIKKWKGVMALKNFEVVRDSLKSKGLFDQERKFVESCGRFATLLYKEEIEVLLRTPGYAGFSLLDLHDYPTQGTALIGPLDAFWDSKGFITPEEYRRFCSTTVPLLRMPKRTYSIKEQLDATVDLAHYGPADIADVKPVWTIKDQKGLEIASGSLPTLKAVTGKLNPLGAIKASLAGAAAPCKLKVTVSLAGTDIANDWDIWVYPALSEIKPPAGVTVAQTWDEASKALADGNKVVFFPGWSNPKQTMRGTFLPVFWSPVWFPNQKPNTMGLLCDPKHPIFAQFPTECSSDWQWYDLMNNSKLINLDATPAGFKPVIQVIDNFQRNNKLGVVFEGRAGKGQLLVCGFDLKVLDNDPAARQFLACLYAYAGSPAFKPAHKLDAGVLNKLFDTTNANRISVLGAKLSASSVAVDGNVYHLVDGDPSTAWITRWRQQEKYPHEIILAFPGPVSLAGLTCLQNQDSKRTGWIKDYEVYISADGKEWGEPVAKGLFPEEAALQKIRFSKNVETKFVKLIILSGFNPTNKCAALAELSLIPCDEKASIEPVINKPAVGIPYTESLRRADVEVAAMKDGQRESLILGNGDLYGIIWEKDNGLFMRITKNDIWDARVDTSKDGELPQVDVVSHAITGALHAQHGYNAFPYPQPRCAVALRLGPVPEKMTGHLNLEKAVATIRSGEKAHTTLRVLHQQNVLLIRGPNPVVLEEIKASTLPAAKLGMTNGVSWLLMNMPGDVDYKGMDYAVAVATNGDLRAVALVTSFDPGEGDVLTRAISLAWKTAAEQEQSLIAKHEQAWHDYWARCGVELADKTMERWWYRMLYFAGTVCRPGTAPVPILPPLATDNTPWHADFHHNYNTWQAYWPLPAVNHSELVDPWISYNLGMIPRYKNLARVTYGLDGLHVPISSFLHEPDPANCKSKNQRQMSMNPWGLTIGLQAMTLQNMWQKYLYDQDVAYMKAKIYPFLREVAAFYVSLMEKCQRDDKGKVRLGPSYSPEHGSPGIFNCPFDIAYVHYTFDAMIEAAETLKTDGELAAKCREFKKLLPDYPTTKRNGEEIVVDWVGGDYIAEHNITVPAAPVFPADQVTWFSDDTQKKLFRQTIQQTRFRDANAHMMFNIARARLSMPEGYTEGRRWFASRELPNGLFVWAGHGHGTFMGEMIGIAGMINEYLLQSVDNKIRLFPCWPADQDASFSRMRAQGGFIVSASFKGGRVASATIESIAHKQLALLSPWKSMQVNGRKAEISKDGLVVIDTKPGDVLVLSETPGCLPR